MIPFLISCAIVLVLIGPAIWAIRFAKRQRVGAAAVAGLLLIFGLNMQVTPPPPPQIEEVQRETEDDEDPAEPKAPRTGSPRVRSCTSRP